MAKTKNKDGSAKYHTGRAKIGSSNLARSRRIDRQVFETAKRSIVTIIIFAMLIVILVTLLSIFQNPETAVRRKIESITSDYYENHFYPEITDGVEGSLDEIMEHYHTHGFAIVSLRQLLLYDNGRHAESTGAITKYCDENSTFARIYPEPPYGKTNYRVEYTYSCAF